MTDSTTLIILALITIALLLFVYFYRLFSTKFDDTTSEGNFSFHSLVQTHEFNLAKVDIEGQNLPWRSAMEKLGHSLKAADVGRILIVHGTFAGEDPLGIAGVIKTIHPSIGGSIAHQIKRIMKNQSDKIFEDNGNYTEAYAKLVEDALGLPCSRILWSSENNHIGRLRGAINLILAIEAEILNAESRPEARLLIMGHSHAGQLFALYTQIVTNRLVRKSFQEIIGNTVVDWTRINSAIKQVSKLKIDFVTFGTPVVYEWANLNNSRCLSIVNHRGISHRSGGLGGILTTKSGDYVQQLGVLGSDTLSLSIQDRKLNKQLDSILGPGLDLRRWKAEFQRHERIMPKGHTALVNYQDQSKTNKPNFLKTLLGHGCYTKYDNMLFNMELIYKILYSGK